MFLDRFSHVVEIVMQVDLPSPRAGILSPVLSLKLCLVYSRSEAIVVICVFLEFCGKKVYELTGESGTKRLEEIASEIENQQGLPPDDGVPM